MNCPAFKMPRRACWMYQIGHFGAILRNLKKMVWKPCWIVELSKTRIDWRQQMKYVGLKINITDYAWDKKSYEEVQINDMLSKPVTKQGLTHILKKYI